LLANKKNFEYFCIILIKGYEKLLQKNDSDDFVRILNLRKRKNYFKKST